MLEVPGVKVIKLFTVKFPDRFRLPAPPDISIIPFAADKVLLMIRSPVIFNDPVVMFNLTTRLAVLEVTLNVKLPVTDIVPAFTFSE